MFVDGIYVIFRKRLTNLLKWMKKLTSDHKMLKRLPESNVFKNNYSISFCERLMEPLCEQISYYLFSTILKSFLWRTGPFWVLFYTLDSLPLQKGCKTNITLSPLRVPLENLIENELLLAILQLGWLAMLRLTNAGYS